MPDDRTNILILIATLARTLFFAGLAALGLASGSLPMSIVFGGLTLVPLWSLRSDLKHGVRPPNRWEWFKAWMRVRPVLIGVVGVAAFMGLLTYGVEIPVSTRQAAAPILAGLTLVWAGLIFYTISRARGRRETDEAYRKRMRYLDLD